MRKARELLTVSISRFFRDQRLWEAVEKYFMQKLRTENGFIGNAPIRVWSAGCACGEEVYSVKIMWEQLGRRLSAVPPMEVWATDTNPEVLEKAGIGIYPHSSLRNMDASLLKDYFTRLSEGYAVSEKLKEGIHWLKHDFVLEYPPTSGFDLIFLRNNLLTYYEPKVKIPALLQILKVLKPGGILVTGNNEEVPIKEVPLMASPEYRSIFAKREAEKSPL